MDFACDLQSIDGRSGCLEAEGGTRVTYVLPLAEANMTADAQGVMVALALNTAGVMARLRPDLDGTSFFNQEGEESGRRITISQSAFLKFGGTSAARAVIANAAKSCCELLLIHFQNDGAVFAQGVQYNTETTAFEVGSKPARIVPSIYSDNSQAESRMEYNITSTVKCFAPCDASTITEAVLDALL